ncbi:hypothetical protein ACH9L7_14195 [Haloferax sp. S1W]|uniref:hypothetical protein n=1 Tax=Haloferax sp. S1W TaxID=3377110 RepID=UPI0037CBD29C
MCFSNLPLEFDEDGNPFLAKEAEAVERPEESHNHDSDAIDRDSGTDNPDADVAADPHADVAADPEAAYEAIVASLPASARHHVDSARHHADGDSADHREAPPKEVAVEGESP